MTGRIHILATLVLDRVYHVDALPGHDEKALASSYEETPGGPGAYIGSAVAGWGRQASLHCVLGRDAAGDLLSGRLAERGVDTSTVVRAADARTAANIVIVDRTGEKAIVIDPIPEPVLARFGAGAAFARGDALVTHIFHPQAVATAASAAREAGASVLVDLEMPEIERWGFDTALAAAARADVICTNGQVLAARTGGSSVDDAARFAATLAGGSRAACVTLGALGSVLHAGGETVRIPPLPVRPTNTTGAGDTFIAGFACALADGAASERAALAASAAAGHFLAGEKTNWAGVLARAEDLVAERLQHVD